MNLKEINNLWEEQIKEFRSSPNVEKGDFSFPLTFWEFILENLKDCSKEIRLEFLNRFLDKEIGSELKFGETNHRTTGNLYLISLVESLPTPVWRKFLWESNADFSSLECFLRRLTADQYILLEEIHKKIISGESPDFFNSKEAKAKESWINDYSYDDRYSSKGAWSYNLFGKGPFKLDFGYNAYPNGEDDDTKVEEVKVSKFLSIKNHADDFVVNKEYGRYYKYYKKVRSNYVWFPKREVELSTHICPGFWYTLWIMLWFFVISPLAFVSTLGGLAQPGELSNLGLISISITATLGSLTPLWVLFAGIKKSFLWLTKGKRGKIIREGGEEFLKAIDDNWEAARITMISIFWCLVGIGIFFSLNLFLNPIPSILISVLLALGAGSAIYYNGYTYPKILRQSLKIVSFLIAIIMVSMYFQEFVVFFNAILVGLVFAFEWIFGAFVTIWGFIVNFGMGWIIFIPAILAAILVYKADKLEKEGKVKELERANTLFEKFSFLLLIIIMIPFGFGTYRLVKAGWYFDFQGLMYLIIVGMTLVSFVFFFIKKPIKKYDEERDEFLQEIWRVLRQRRVEGITKKDYPSLVGSVIANPFFNKDNFEKEYIKLIECTRNVRWEFHRWFMSLALFDYSPELVPSLKGLFGAYDYEWADSSQKRSLIYDLITERKTHQEVFRAIEENSEKWMERWRIFGKIMKYTFYPLVLLWKLVQSLAVLKKVAEDLNRRCPYIYETKDLSKKKTNFSSLY